MEFKERLDDIFPNCLKSKIPLLNDVDLDLILEFTKTVYYIIQSF